MTVTVKNIIPAKVAENTATIQYTAVNCRTIIDKFTATNTSGANVLFSVNLVSNGGSAGTNNLVISNRGIAPNESYTCPELIGHVIESSGTIITTAGTAAALTIRSTGREITT